MSKEELLKKYFPKVKDFRDIQEPTIDALIDGEKVLCLMPTGGGKSLIYQIAGLEIGKATLVISPLVALMSQQCKQLTAQGLLSINFSGMDYRKQFKTITDMANGVLPKFIFTSPERISNDGYLEYMLTKRKDDIGLVVVDEVHCVSQWGEGFRPAYRNIPLFMNRIFGNDWPRVLCLTATLNEKQQKQICDEFKITKLIKGENLWRENLHLEIINLKDGKDETKDDELERIIEKHKGEKILVFAHRKKGNKGTTRSLYEKYKDKYEGVAFFDSDISDTDKETVLQGFASGDIKIVFATSAFGMGVDIGDIRVVVNYLISETVEQYYQEVGRGGRDGAPSYGYLIYTNQSKRGRRMLLNQTLCTETTLNDEWDNRKLEDGQPLDHASYETMTEEQRTAFALLMDYGVISVVAKGVQSIKCFDGVTKEGKEFLEELSKFSKSGLMKIIAKKSGENISTLSLKIWDKCISGDIKMKAAPSKALFYTINKEMTDEIKAQILKDQEQKKESRVAAFERFVDGIEAGKTAEQLVKEALDI
ncbi:RecQ family ATP-dependent DNA helicase [Butyrivibrio sp. XPD2006]|uniref:RecQ family ATP-dependent DNA helicase n=1 Tax=Butyrivibrio sp. XPD2006 TaxID=1280668 RepID=UPI0003B73349|nr:RecQ family ATP-dependent DNA helicase [Butyrivibrio sp. XPD2006]